MANVQQITRDYLLRARTEGVAETTAAAQRLGGATDALATKTETVTKSQVSAAAALERQQRQLDLNYQSMKRMEQAQRDLDRAQQQGLISTARHAELMALASQRYTQATNTQKALGIATNDLQGRVAAAASATGTFGGVLSALGPIGLAVAAVIGGVSLALKSMSDSSHELAEKAQELRRFAEVTGLTTAQVQALRSEASKFGVTSEEAQTAIQNFTARFDQLRIGQGELLAQIRRVNPALADQMQITTNVGDALTLFAQGLDKVDNVFQRNALVKAATGRGGIGAAEFLKSLNVDSLTASYIAAGKGLDDNLIKKTAQLEIDIKKLSGAAKQQISSIFAQDVLQQEKEFYETLLSIAKTIKEISNWTPTIPGWVEKALRAAQTLSLDPRTQAGVMLKQGLTYGASSSDIAQQISDSVPRRGANDNVATPATAATNKTLEAQVEDMKKLIAVLGPAATASEQLALKQKELELAARDAGVGAAVLQRAQAALNAEFALSKLRENISALGAAATPLEQYTLRVAELTSKLNLGAISQETFNRAVADLKNDQAMTAMRNNITALGSAATAADQYKLKAAELQQQLDRGQISQATFNRALFEADPLVQDLKSNVGDLAKGLVQSMMAGKSFTDSLSTGLKQLSGRLADKAIEQLLSGDFEKAAISATSAIVTYLGSLFTGNSAAKHADVIKSIDYVSQLQVRQIAATADMATLAGQLTAFDKNANIERMNNDRDGQRERNQLELTLSEERAKIISDFSKEAVEAEKQAAADRLAAQEEINRRQQTFQDRLLQATTDQTTLAGQLTLLDRQQQRERESEVASGGQALVDLEAAQAAERFNTIKSFNDKIVDDAKKTAQEQLDAQTKAARSIVDYINSTNVGAESSLSPSARLSAAQGTYNSILALAQGGNADALGRITQDAENLRKALKDMFASGAGFQSGWATIQAQLLSLPAVATSTDPVVAAIRDSIVATQNVQVAVQADTTALVTNFNIAINKFSDAVTYLAQAVNQLVTSNALLDAIRALNDTSKQQLVLLTSQLTSASGTFFQPASAAGVTVNRNILDALRAIVVNTFAISLNTARSVDFQRNGVGDPGFIGTLAGGGWIRGGIPNKDSVLLGSRTAIGMPGEFVVNKEVAQANVSSLQMFNETGQWPRPNMNTSFAAPSSTAANSNWPSSGGSSSNDKAIDYRPHFAGLANTNSRGFSELARRLERIEDAIYGGAEKTAEAVKQAPAQRPGVKSKAA